MENDIKTSLARLRNEFIIGLSARLSALEQQLTGIADGRVESLETIRRMAHSLACAAGMYKLTALADAVHELERIVLAWPQTQVDSAGVTAIKVALEKIKIQADKSIAGFILSSQADSATPLPLIALLVDDIKQRRRLVALLEQAGYRVDEFSTYEAFKGAYQAEIIPVAIIMAMSVLAAQSSDNAISVLKAENFAMIPVIVLSSDQNATTKLAAYRAGASYCLATPFNTDVLLQIIAESVIPVAEEPFRVLLVNDDQPQIAAHARSLRQAGMEVLTETNPLQVAQLLTKFKAEVLVSAVFMAQCSGPELAAMLRDDGILKQLPVIYLATDTDIPEQLLALNRRGDVFLKQPVTRCYLTSVIALHACRYRKAQKQAKDLRAADYDRDRQQMAFDAHAAISIADAHCVLTYVNERFCENSGYSRSEILGGNCRFMDSNRYAPEVHAQIQKTIQQGEIWKGELCSRRKDGSVLWEEASIVPFLDENGRLYQYVSILTDITRLKETELSLSVLNRTMEASSCAVIVTDARDPELPIIYVNPAFEKITGYAALDVVGKNCRFLQGNDCDQPDLTKIRAAIKAEQSTTVLLRNYRKDGALFWNYLRIAPVRNADNELTHFIGIADDITARKQAEENRQELFERFEKMAGRLPGMIYQYRQYPDGSSSFPYASEGVRDIYRVSPDAIKEDASAVLSCLHPDDYAAVIAAHQISARDLTLWHQEYRVRFKDGTVRWLFGNALPEREPDGSTLWHGFITDVTERRHVERVLQQSTRHAQAVFDNVIDGIITIDECGIMQSVNRAAEKIFGYDAREMVGNNVSMLMPEPYSSQHDSYMQHYLAGGTARIIGIDREVEGRRQDGHVFPMDLAVSEIVDEDQHLFVGLVRDISERKHILEALIAAKTEAERANVAKSKFLSSMSHELRTPMNGVLGFAQLLQLDDTLSEENKENVHEILKAGQHLLGLINEVLNLAKIESGTLELTITPVALDNTVKECLALIRSLAETTDIRIESADFSNISVYADSMRLKQVLINLLSNAIKYNRSHGIVKLFFSEGDESDRLRIIVSDTGVGISEQRLHEIFEPFNRLGAESLNIQGTGIGLTICQHLIELMGGEIGVDSRYEEGSTFWIELDRVSPV